MHLHNFPRKILAQAVKNVHDQTFILWQIKVNLDNDDYFQEKPHDTDNFIAYQTLSNVQGLLSELYFERIAS